MLLDRFPSNLMKTQTETLEFIKFHEPSENREMWCVRKDHTYLSRDNSHTGYPAVWREINDCLPYITGEKSLNMHSPEVKRNIKNQINTFLDFHAFNTFYEATIAAVSRVTLDNETTKH